jgi:hypothetical protein
LRFGVVDALPMSIYAETTAQSLPFPLQHIWGQNSERIVDHIVLAEFDIDTGRLVSA